jgi:hypothetical protein
MNTPTTSLMAWVGPANSPAASQRSLEVYAIRYSYKAKASMKHSIGRLRSDCMCERNMRHDVEVVSRSKSKQFVNDRVLPLPFAINIKTYLST